MLPIALVVLLLGFAAVDSRVLSPANLLNIAQQTSYLALFAMAQTVVILTRGFDLALGPTVSMVSVGTALAMAGATASGHDTTTVLLARTWRRLRPWHRVRPVQRRGDRAARCEPLCRDPRQLQYRDRRRDDAVGRTAGAGRTEHVLADLLRRQHIRCPRRHRDHRRDRHRAATDAGAYRVRPLALHHRHQPARRSGGGLAGEAHPGSHLCAVLGARRPRRHHDDGAHRLGRTQSRRLAVAAGDRRRRGRRNEPAPADAAGSAPRCSAPCSSPSSPTA